MAEQEMKQSERLSDEKRMRRLCPIDFRLARRGVRRS